MAYVLLRGLEDADTGDIVGAIAGETGVDPDDLGDIDIRRSRAYIETSDAEALADEIDGARVGRSSVESEALEDEQLEKKLRIEEYIDDYRKLVELEREEEMREHEKEIGELSGDEREEKGRAILQLSGDDNGEGIEGFRVKFSRKGDKLPENEIAVGDLVMISKNDPLRDDNPTGTVLEKTKRSLTVAFDGQPQDFVFSSGLRMDLYVNDITYRRMQDALEKMAGEVFEERLRDLITGEEETRSPEPAEIDGWNNSRLNEPQREAVKQAVGSDEIHLVHGPPGTGKTTTAIEVVQQYIEKDQTVLATAASNTAVDNILEFLLEQEVEAVRVGHPARVTSELRENTLEALVREKEKYRESEELREQAFELKDDQKDLTTPSGRWRRGMSDEKIKELAEKGEGSRGVPEERITEMAEWLELQEEMDELFSRAEELRDEAVEDILESAEVVCTTNSTAGSDLMENRRFDAVVIDEATQATEPSCLIPIAHGEEVVMAGDHRQLPPTVKNQEAAQRLEHSLFERLADDNPEIRSLLTRQYRMHEDIMEFSSQEFYDGKLEADDMVRTHTLADLSFELEASDWSKVLAPEAPVVFIDTKGVDASESSRPGSTSKENEREAELVEEIAKEALHGGLEEEQISVITPYTDQSELIEQKIRRQGMEIKTVDGFQGREKEAVIISLVRSNERGEIGFLKDYRRINVALTRAKRKLVVIGDSGTLRSDEVYSRLIDYVQENGRYIRL